MLISKRMYAVVAAATAGIVTATVAPAAHAGTMIQGFDQARDYSSSRDFIPNVRSFYIGGYACPGGTGIKFRVSLLKTSNKNILYASPTRPSDSQWAHWPVTTPYVNQAHYVRITYLKQDDGVGATFCSGVSADW